MQVWALFWKAQTSASNNFLPMEKSVVPLKLSSKMPLTKYHKASISPDLACIWDKKAFTSLLATDKTEMCFCLIKILFWQQMSLQK